MSDQVIGILCGLGTAVCWSCSAFCFQSAGRRMGSLPVNVIRLAMALAFLTAVGWLARGHAWPADATRHQWAWLLASGFVGFFIGDLPLFRAFVLIGARLSTLVMALAPVFAALTAWWLLDEPLGALQALGMATTLAGVVLVVLDERKPAAMQVTATQLDAEDAAPSAVAGSLARSTLTIGVLMALVGAIAQGVGVTFVKQAYAHGDFDAFATTQIRALAGVPAFLLAMLVARKSLETVQAFGNGMGMVLTTTGAIFGPVVGVSLLNQSVKYVQPGVAQTLAALVPVLILPLAIWLGRERVGWKGVAGAIVAVVGVVLLTIGTERLK